MEALFNEFLEEVEKEYLHVLSVRNAQKAAMPDVPIRPFTLNDFKHICTEIAKRLKTVYSELVNETHPKYQLQVLFVAYELVGAERVANLFYMDMHGCFPYPMEEGKIVEIGQPDLGKIFLKSYENGNFSMEEMSRLASFIIKYVEKEKLAFEDGVGVGNEQPQIWFYPDSDTQAVPYEIQGVDLKKLLHDVDDEVEKVRKQVGSTSKFLRS